MTVPAEWHEEMRTRAMDLLMRIEDRLPPRTVGLVHELIDANEYGVATEMMRDVAVEVGAVLTSSENAELRVMLDRMRLEPGA